MAHEPTTHGIKNNWKERPNRASNNKNKNYTKTPSETSIFIHVFFWWLPSPSLTCCRTVYAEVVGLMHMHQPEIYSFRWIVMIRPNDDPICISGTGHQNKLTKCGRKWFSSVLNTYRSQAGNSPSKYFPKKCHLGTVDINRQNYLEKYCRPTGRCRNVVQNAQIMNRMDRHGCTAEVDVSLVQVKSCAIYQLKWTELTWFISYTHTLTHSRNIKCYKCSDR